MSQQRDLPESMSMACYRQTGIRANTTQCRGRCWTPPEVLLQGCGIDSKKQEMLDVDSGAGRPRATTSTDDRYI
ncbi:hypothetical protein TNCV_2755621 [Trichonephila clavipes]|nr:hypothetical protein TNCV_2755621 [Trichonephila clavipes]